MLQGPGGSERGDREMREEIVMILTAASQSRSLRLNASKMWRRVPNGVEDELQGCKGSVDSLLWLPSLFKASSEAKQVKSRIPKCSMLSRVNGRGAWRIILGRSSCTGLFAEILDRTRIAFERC